ncbi:RNA polymerase sigma-54 factor RpoN [Olavius sp. associated proteobacterium Delta 1]|nr:RNA polymerase sigma-54 factor RpoN [Olavius sp. associated proteobacterium Delta 1]
MREKPDFKEIYKEFQPKIVHYLRRLLGNQDAEDIAQEVFAKVSRGLDSFKGRSKPSTWIYRIATNTAIDKLRSASFKRSSENTSLIDETIVADRNDSFDHMDPPPDQKVIRKEMSQCVREYIDRLAPDHRSVLVLSELEGFKNREIADILEISLENVKVRLHRARASLKKVLDDGCDFYRNEAGTLACDRKPVYIESKKPD